MSSQILLDIWCKGSLDSNGVCIDKQRKDNSSSYVKIVRQEEMMKDLERLKDPKTKGSSCATYRAPLSSLANTTLLREGIA